MITVKKLRVEIVTFDGELFGFDFPFHKGLNIITGENSSGKSSVLSCICYGLGMEQLVGGYNADIFKDAFTERFEYNNEIYRVINSKVELHFENKHNIRATTSRVIFDGSSDLDEIMVKEGNKKQEIKTIDEDRDTPTDDKFYNWLIRFLGIEMPTYIDNDTDEEEEILYLQDIFSVALVEQMKGWTDFLALIRSKKSKRRIIEYTLGLRSLENEYKNELLAKKEKEHKKRWQAEVKMFRSLANYSGFGIRPRTFNYNKEFTAERIDNRLNLERENEQKKILSVEIILSNLEEKLKVLKEKNLIKPSTNNRNNDLINQQEGLQEDIKLLREELEKFKLETLNEEYKQESYKRRLNQISKEIKILESIEKIDKLSELSLKDVKNCPVCNSELTVTNATELKNQEQISESESILFYKSEKSLYDAYLKNSDVLMSRLNKTIAYYQNRIIDKQNQLAAINRDLISDDRLPSRKNIAEEVSIERELGEIMKLNKEFIILKEQLKEISNKLRRLSIQRKELKRNVDEDENIKSSYKNRFKELLKEFNYPLEQIKQVILPAYLIPMLKEWNSRKTTSMTRKEAASDFIRASWAFYLVLLEKAKRHLNLLILDEPGQHSMNTDEMRKLIELTSNMKDKQIILAISKDKSKNENTPLEDLLKGFKEKTDYHINVIDDNNINNRLIQPL